MTPKHEKNTAMKVHEREELQRLTNVTMFHFSHVRT